MTECVVSSVKFGSEGRLQTFRHFREKAPFLLQHTETSCSQRHGNRSRTAPFCLNMTAHQDAKPSSIRTDWLPVAFISIIYKVLISFNCHHVCIEHNYMHGE